MRIDLNGVTVSTEAQTLEELVLEFGFPPTAVATALNGVFVPRTARRTTVLSEGVKIEVLSPMQGG